MKHSSFFVALLSFAFTTSVYSQQWVQTNGPGGGGIYSAAVNSQGHIFVGSHSLHRSTDGGKTWVYLLPDSLQKVGTISKILIQPSNAVFLRGGNYIFRSLDNGDTWTRVSTAYPLFQGANGELFTFRSDSSKLSRSTDDGVTWQDLSTSGIQFDYYGPADVTSDNAGRIFLCADYLYRSIDNGKSWSKIVNGIPSDKQPFSSIEVANSGELFGYHSSQAYLYRSTDGGRIWDLDTVITKSLASPSSYSHLYYLSINQNNDLLILSSKGKAIVSQDGGLTLKSPDKVRPYGERAVVEPNGNFLIASSTKIYILDPNALDQVDSFIVPNGNVSALLTDKNNNLCGFTYLDTYPYNNSWHSVDMGTHWEYTQVSDQVNTLALDSSQNFLGGAGGKIITSTNSGKTWFNLSTNLTSDTLTALMVSFNGDIFAASNTEGIFRSSDKGVTWDQLNSGITDLHLYSLVSRSNRSVFTGGGNIIYRSDDGGFTWSILDTQFPSNTGNVTALAGNARGDIFAGVEKGGIFWSTDNGVTWRSRATGLIASNIYTLLPTPGGNVLAGTEQGVFLIDSSPASNWIPYNLGLTVKKVKSLCIGGDGYVYAGTDASGVFRSVETFNTYKVTMTVRTGRNLTENTLSPNYPNPFSSSTTIPFSLGEGSYITLDVLDALGRTVARVADGVFIDGKYEEKFEAGNLPAGTYFIRLRTEKESYLNGCVLSK